MNEPNILLFPVKNKNIKFDLLFILSFKLLNCKPSLFALYNNLILFIFILLASKLYNLYNSSLFFIIKESISDISYIFPNDLIV